MLLESSSYEKIICGKNLVEIRIGARTLFLMLMIARDLYKRRNTETYRFEQKVDR